jgi:hypothetical protein
VIWLVSLPALAKRQTGAEYRSLWLTLLISIDSYFRGAKDDTGGNSRRVGSAVSARCRLLALISADVLIAPQEQRNSLPFITLASLAAAAKIVSPQPGTLVALRGEMPQRAN